MNQETSHKNDIQVHHCVQDINCTWTAF